MKMRFTKSSLKDIKYWKLNTSKGVFFSAVLLIYFGSSSFINFKFSSVFF